MPASARRELPLAALVIMAAVLLALRTAVSLYVQPMGDEAYYWVWGQRPGLSYYDHPPLQAWLQAASSALLGPGTLALRLPAWLTLAGSFYVLYLFIRRAWGEDWQRPWLISVILLLGSPLFLIYTTIATPDHLLVTLGLLALYLMARFFEGADAGAPQWRYLFGAAVFIGLTCLTKYIGVVLLLGLAIAIVMSPARRRLLLDWRLYAAGLVTVAMQLPVLLWNIETGFSSIRLHLVDRQRFDSGLTWVHLVSFVLQLLIFAGPFLVWPTVKAFLNREHGFAGVTQSLARATYAGSTLGFMAIALRTFVSGHWNILGQAALIPALVRQIGARWQLALHWLYGAAMGALLLVNYTIYPVLGVDTLETYRAYGWEEIAAAYAEEAEKARPEFLAASHYMLASQLNLMRKSTEVTALSQRLDQYDYWFDDADHIGESALILDDLHSPLEPIIAESFETVTELKRLQIFQRGVLTGTFRIYLATGYRGAPAEGSLYRR